MYVRKCKIKYPKHSVVRKFSAEMPESLPKIFSASNFFEKITKKLYIYA